MTEVRFKEADVKIIMTSKMDLKYPSSGTTRQMPFRLPSLTRLPFFYALLKNLWKAKASSVVFVSNPGKEELIFIYLAKALYGSRIRTFVFDLIMQNPVHQPKRAFTGIKCRLLQAVDTFIFIHKDMSGYELGYGIPRVHCEYVPFKANNFDLAKTIDSIDGDYVVALGASHRDYKLLIEAIKDSKIPLKLILPQSSIAAHGTQIASTLLPENVERVDSPVNRIEWSNFIARSRLVVIPILPGVIQPAGISVYLEAMILGKPVVITRGASTEGILNERLAVLVPPGDAAALSTAIARVWSDEKLRKKLAESGKRYALSLGTHERLLADLKSVIQRKCAPLLSQQPHP